LRRLLAEHVELQPTNIAAYMLPLSRAIDPPAFAATPTTQEWLDTLKEACNPIDWTSFSRWLGTTKLPVVVVVALPMPDSPIPALIACRFDRATAHRRKEALHGFRVLHAQREIRFAGEQTLGRYSVQRLDAAFLVRRGGAPGFGDSRVVVVGCGAVGSALAVNLAALGVGNLDLIDLDSLKEENVHRHVLGIEAIGRNKAVALAEHLGRRFPHQAVRAHPQDILALLESSAAILLEADAVVIAVGDETLERRVNSVLGFNVPRVHVWVEPLGAGGHVLVTGLQAGILTAGCYECLFTRDESGLLTNSAAFAAANQQFGQSLAGCAGTFSPFSALDANRTALEAATMVGQVLSAELRVPTLNSWRGDRGDFERGLWRLSTRGEAIQPGTRVIAPSDQFARLDCRVCGSPKSHT